MSADATFFESGLQLLQGRGNLKCALGNMLPIVAQLAGSDGASLFIVDESEMVLKPLVTVGLPESYVRLCGIIPVGEQCCGRAVKERKLWIVSDMLTDPLFASAKKASAETTIRAAFSVPVILEDGTCVGSLACHYKRPYTPTAQNISVNRTWATLIAHTLSEFHGTHLAPQMDQASA
jgi:GAF domain-containing protein